MKANLLVEKMKLLLAKEQFEEEQRQNEIASQMMRRLIDYESTR
jgi:hypothetical protein